MSLSLGSPTGNFQKHWIGILTLFRGLNFEPSGFDTDARLHPSRSQHRIKRPCEGIQYPSASIDVFSSAVWTRRRHDEAAMQCLGCQSRVCFEFKFGSLPGTYHNEALVEHFSRADSVRIANVLKRTGAMTWLMDSWSQPGRKAKVKLYGLG